MMKTTGVLNFIAAGLLLATASCTKTIEPTAPDQIDGGRNVARNSSSKVVLSVHGGGTSPEGTTLELSTFTVNAMKFADGSVKGQLIYQWRSGDVTTFHDVTCLQVVDNVATIVATTTKVQGVGADDYWFIKEGFEVYFTVKDMGEGSADPDLFSDVSFDVTPETPINCNNIPLADAYIPLSGNFQIKIH